MIFDLMQVTPLPKPLDKNETNKANPSGLL